MSPSMAYLALCPQPSRAQSKSYVNVVLFVPENIIIRCLWLRESGEINPMPTHLTVALAV